MLTPNVKEFQTTLIASIPLFLCGVDASFAADLNNLIHNKTITLFEESLIGSINMYARALGAMGTGYLVNKIGRKNSIQVSLSLYTTGWIIITYFSYSVEILYFGRILSGLAAGMRTAVLLYISEVAHKSRRGRLLAFCGLATSVGVCFTYLLQYFFTPKIVSVFALIISLFGLIQTLFLYETKYWFLMKNRPEEAQLSMLWFNDAMSVKDTLEEIKEIQIQQEQSLKGNKCFAICKQWSSVKHLIICILIFCTRAGSGRVPLLVHPHNYYKLFILPVNTEIATVTQGILEIVFSLLHLGIADAFPRKRMLQFCCWTMSTCLIISYLQVTLVETMGIFGEWIIFISLMLYSGLACGFLFVLIMITIMEVASAVTELRGIIISTCQICNQFLNGIYTSIFPFVLVSVPVNYVLLFMFTNLMILSLLVILIPETVGKALHKCDWEKEKVKRNSLLSESGEKDLREFEADTEKLLSS